MAATDNSGMASKDVSAVAPKDTSVAFVHIPDGRSREFSWGCELSEENPECAWEFGGVEEEEEDKDFMEHTLFLRHATLGVKADITERHVVEMETRDYSNKLLRHPIVSLGGVGMQMASVDLNFSDLHKLTFRLILGKGPIHLTAQQLVEFPKDDEDYDTEASFTATEMEEEVEEVEEVEDEEEEEGLDEVDDDEEEEEDEEPISKGKKRKATTPKAVTKKKGKMEREQSEEEESEEEMEEDEESEDSPLKKMRVVKAQAKGTKTTPKPKQSKKQQQQQPQRRTPISKAKGKKEKAGKKKSK